MCSLSARFQLAVVVAVVALAVPAIAYAQESAAIVQVPKTSYDVGRVSGIFDKLEAEKSTAVFSFADRAKASFPEIPIPMFVPGELLEDLASGSAKSATDPADDTATACRGDGSLVEHPDGYLASCAFETFDLVIEGTSRVFGTDTSKSTAEAATVDYVGDISDGEAGVSVPFGFAGAHYIAFFECRKGEADCVSEKGAKDLIDRLVLCALGGKCLENGTAVIEAQR